uniref:MARVEL domain containing 1 n=1 Tax=Scleropages formosus TaxID=113540 RepID=A0A8C9SCW5_SCLFO
MNPTDYIGPCTAGTPPPTPCLLKPGHCSLQFLRSIIGVARILQILLGAGLWAIIAANKYDGPVHFVLFVAVLFWLLTLALFFITLLGKQDLVPLVGGDRWLTTNAAHDLVAALLYLPAIGVMAYKTERSAYCNVEHYKHPCPYKAYLAASTFSCLCASAYFLSAVYGSCRKCRGEQTVF